MNISQYKYLVFFKLHIQQLIQRLKQTVLNYCGVPCMKLQTVYHGTLY